ncbi:MAG: tetratricopeptide repeat protein [Desulfobulbaceae bacterium]|nr:tetratricopeptide repeat protein [Desulfobulbaceae bacterium]
MDWLDKLNIIVLAVLVLITAGMLTQHEIMDKKQAGPETESREVLNKLYEERVARDAETYREVIAFQEQGRHSEAMTKLEEIIQSHPENPQSYVYKARILNNLGELAEAIGMYRAAVEMEPDFVDNKTPIFIGDTVMDLITVARGKLNREKKLKPGDKTVRLALDNIYYLQRRIAGGCE